METIGKVLYQEKCGECELYISEYGYDWIVGGIIEGQTVEKTFRPNAYANNYESAIEMYDKTLDYASRKYGIDRVMPDKPNFEVIITI
jgi:hypothetical protein